MPRGQGGTLSGFTPLSTPNAPTDLSVSTSIGSASVSFTPPADTGDAAVTSYVVTAIDESTGVSTGATGSSSPISISPGGGTFKIRAQAVNGFGPGRLTEFLTGQGILSGAELYAWGSPNSGALGNNTVSGNIVSPVLIGALTDWSEVSVGDYHSLAIKTNGTLWAWGNNSQGRLGDGTSLPRSSPVQLGALTNWSQAAGGGSMTGAVKSDGTLWTWGYGGYGRLGNNSVISQSSPVQIGSGTSWSHFSAGANDSFAVSAAGALYAWGRNRHGENAQNDSFTVNSVARSSPTQVGALTDWRYVAGGQYHVLAIKTNNTLWMWGREAISGCLGQNTYSTSRSSPVQVGALTNWATGSVGVFQTVAVKTDGTLWSWGRGYNGLLGQNNIISRSSPVQVGSLTNWSAVSTRFNHTVAIKTDGTLWSWGVGGSGRLGDGQSNNRSSPVQIGALNTWVTAAASNGHSLANLGVI